MWDLGSGRELHSLVNGPDRGIEVLHDLGDETIGLAHLENLFDVLPAPLAAKVRSAESVPFGQSPADFVRIHGDVLQLFDHNRPIFLGRAG